MQQLRCDCFELASSMIEGHALFSSNLWDLVKVHCRWSQGRRSRVVTPISWNGLVQVKLSLPNGWDVPGIVICSLQGIKVTVGLLCQCIFGEAFHQDVPYCISRDHAKTVKYNVLNVFVIEQPFMKYIQSAFVLI